MATYTSRLTCPSMAQIDELCTITASYLGPSQISVLRHAHEFGAVAHTGQKRRSGEPYIEHPLAVALILAAMHMDLETLVAAILHDVLEDTEVEKGYIRVKFGDDVAELVDGVSKLTQMEFESYAEAQAQNYSKMLMAMANDLRVILVKLADRLHNMRTIEALKRHKRRRIARETLDIYAPISQRLGLHTFRLELEDLGFKTLYPMRYRVLEQSVKRVRGNRKEIIETIKESIKKGFAEEQLPQDVLGREKHIYSIYKKMREQRLSFAEVFDVYAFRLIVGSVDTCYRALGIVHNLYKPVPGKFKDYIAIPKANGYQSLHTVLFGPFGVPIEIQIRTKEMDQVAEAGIAAHWLYKSGETSSHSAHTRAHEWLKRLLEMQQKAGNSEEFLENIKADLFPDEVYVFTPKGEIRQLPRGATAVDLAYSVHTDIGNQCVAARVDRRLVPLRTPLFTGQSVEIITAPGARPNPAWLNFVATARARSHIRHFLKNLRSDEARQLGERMLNRELEQFQTNLDTLPNDALHRTLKEHGFTDLEQLLADIGLGNSLAPIIARNLTSALKDGRPSTEEHDGMLSPLSIKGTEGMVVTLPKCCHPIPGDPILGVLSKGRGLVVHHQSCKNLIEVRTHPEKWIDLEWEKDINSEFSAEMRVEANNQRGALATIAATIADLGANIEDVKITDRDDQYALLIFVIAVRDRHHLAQIIRTIKGVDAVDKVIRSKA